MKTLFVIAFVVGLGTSHHIPVGVTVGLSPYSHPVQSLYHSQDNYGQYVYGYATPTSTKSESKTADGVTQGGYSYIDSHGILQTVQYIADSVHGFRVAATNLPQDLPEVALAKAQHYQDYARIASRVIKYSNPIAVPYVHTLPTPVQDLPEVAKAKAAHLATLQAAYAGILPQPVQDLPEVAKARAEHLAQVAAVRARDTAASLSPIPDHFTGSVVPVHVQTVASVPVVPSYQSQYHAQDGLGQYSYGYISPLSEKSEAKGADGVTRGGYSYIDANGILQTVNYVSDSVHGFRVAATNLPVAPKVKLIAPQAHTTIQEAVPAAEAVVHQQVKTVIPALYTQEVVY